MSCVWAGKTWTASGYNSWGSHTQTFSNFVFDIPEFNIYCRYYSTNMYNIFVHIQGKEIQLVLKVEVSLPSQEDHLDKDEWKNKNSAFQKHLW